MVKVELIFDIKTESRRGKDKSHLSLQPSYLIEKGHPEKAHNISLLFF